MQGSKYRGRILNRFPTWQHGAKDALAFSREPEHDRLIRSFPQWNPYMQPLFQRHSFFMLEYQPHVRVYNLFCKNNSFMYELFLHPSYMRGIFQHECRNALEYGPHVRVQCSSRRIKSMHIQRCANEGVIGCFETAAQHWFVPGQVKACPFSLKTAHCVVFRALGPSSVRFPGRLPKAKQPRGCRAVGNAGVPGGIPFRCAK